MSSVTPFRGLRYDPSIVGNAEAATSPPYDVISDEQQEHYRRLSPYNVVHLEFNDKVVAEELRAQRYQEAADDLAAWRVSGALRLDDEPAYYPFEMDFPFSGGRRRIRGLICSVGIEDWGGSIVPHEHVMAKQVEDRLGLMRLTRANFSPIYAVFPGPCLPLEGLFDGLSEPLLSVTDDDGVIHRSWRAVNDGITPWFADRELLIADGHHRYTMALAYAKEMRAAHGAGPWDEVMMLIVDATSEVPPVLPIHRILKRPLEGVTVEPVADLDAALAAADDDEPAVGVIEPGRYGVLRLDGVSPTVSALHAGLLAGWEGGRDLVFTADAAEADRAVTTGTAPMALLLPITSAERIQQVIARGERMPQKSTFFWPKPRTGLVLRAMDPGAPGV